MSRQRDGLFTRPERLEAKTVRQVRDAAGHKIPTSIALTPTERATFDAYCSEAGQSRGTAVGALLQSHGELQALRRALLVRYGKEFIEGLLAKRPEERTASETTQHESGGR